ncbi:hypothetical protein AMTR_s00034p00196340 [Amborella trichopoda]|uniref:Nudix hydrolase domain-containing protein n=1 Tax=Amborella trichopoda TaxID=13333 RepID=W1PXQ7_AMBTC|nr:hypothetical protein AMTR_s00034p00196340 [Amborella trichopoda]
MPASSPPPRAYSILFACPTGLSRSQVFVDFSASYDRMPHPDPRLEESISQIWDQRLHENPSLYNGLKFRFGGYLVHTTDEDLGNDSNVCIHLGLTDYRTFVGTNLSPLWEKFLISDENDSICGQHTASPLGNGAVVESADGKILVLQRSYNVGEFPGHYVFPGGHSEIQWLYIPVILTPRSNQDSKVDFRTPRDDLGTTKLSKAALVVCRDRYTIWCPRRIRSKTRGHQSDAVLPEPAIIPSHNPKPHPPNPDLPPTLPSHKS